MDVHQVPDGWLVNYDNSRSKGEQWFFRKSLKGRFSKHARYIPIKFIGEPRYFNEDNRPTD